MRFFVSNKLWYYYIMEKYKKGLLYSLIFVIFIAICVTLFVKNFNREVEEPFVIPEVVDEQKVQKEETLKKLDDLLPENQKTEAEKKEDLDLLEKSKQDVEESVTSDLDLLDINEPTEEEKRKIDLLNSLSN